ncbi:endolytic transglycosylase MltG [Streptosporangium sp. NBC_01756]|uniref:endolytic transglycosylase MltG n=1 Tax=Streptosporangium sp. NBC_01756 TaxID=2975950 RepID=UPI002DD7FBE6|nr:endolytic transglycosylase MltG [Streptosporangium sp. NBC_01756]WSC90604.1 endolytic transglycosylase MltG [Streptosporangium sp. NBC_01756]
MVDDDLTGSPPHEGKSRFAFPATYEVSPTSSPDELLTAMVTRFNRAAEDSNLVDGARRVGRTPLEITTIASIVQAESTDRRDMPKVARVLYNRLNHTPEMKLQLDSTIMYGVSFSAVNDRACNSSPSMASTVQAASSAA